MEKTGIKAMLFKNVTLLAFLEMGKKEKNFSPRALSEMHSGNNSINNNIQNTGNQLLFASNPHIE